MGVLIRIPSPLVPLFDASQMVDENDVPRNVQPGEDPVTTFVYLKGLFMHYVNLYPANDRFRRRDYIMCPTCHQRKALLRTIYGLTVMPLFYMLVDRAVKEGITVYAHTYPNFTGSLGDPLDLSVLIEGSYAPADPGKFFLILLKSCDSLD